MPKARLTENLVASTIRPSCAVTTSTTPASQVGTHDILVFMTVNLPEVYIQDRAVLEDGSARQNDGVRGTRIDSRQIFLAAQLGCLASQHHASEYNCQKYGLKGAPLAYMPLSLHFPEHFKRLLEQQALYVGRKAWWPCQKPLHPLKRNTSINVQGPTLVRASYDTITLQEDLLSAISSPLTPQTKEYIPAMDSIPPVKTSQSHPLNISIMIPYELISIISAHLATSTGSSPIMFEVPLSYQLHRIIAVPPRPMQLPVLTTPLEHALQHSRAPRPVSSGFVNVLWNQKLMRKAFISSASVSPPSPTRATSNPYSVMLGKKATRPHSVSITPVPALQRFSSADCSYGGSTESEKAARHLAPNTPPSAGVTYRPGTYDAGNALTKSSVMRRSQGTTASPPQKLGNLYLSSCPGKKVRLNGPVNGRSGVCRDLMQDLRRIRELGVGCVVCCLDDEELQYLGAPWEEYSRTADELGLDVLRIPTPEGLAPIDPAHLDGYLDRLIQAYTLRGTPILVHCRGGVGRAGLVACCWALKLGLCGWIETQPSCPSRLAFTAPEDLSESPPLDESGGGVRRDTLQLVERVITLVRRRRSYKAVETFEQVKFLVDYVELLRKKSRTGAVTVGSVIDRDIRAQ